MHRTQEPAQCTVHIMDGEDRRRGCRERAFLQQTSKPVENRTERFWSHSCLLYQIEAEACRIRGEREGLVGDSADLHKAAKGREEFSRRTRTFTSETIQDHIDS